MLGWEEEQQIMAMHLRWGIRGSRWIHVLTKKINKTENSQKHTKVIRIQSHTLSLKVKSNKELISNNGTNPIEENPS